MKQIIRGVGQMHRVRVGQYATAPATVTKVEASWPALRSSSRD